MGRRSHHEQPYCLQPNLRQLLIPTKQWSLRMVWIPLNGCLTVYQRLRSLRNQWRSHGKHLWRNFVQILRLLLHWTQVLSHWVTRSYRFPGRWLILFWVHHDNGPHRQVNLHLRRLPIRGYCLLLRPRYFLFERSFWKESCLRLRLCPGHLTKESDRARASLRPLFNFNNLLILMLKRQILDYLRSDKHLSWRWGYKYVGELHDLWRGCPLMCCVFWLWQS